MFNCIVTIIYLLVKANSQLITRTKPEYIYIHVEEGLARKGVQKGEAGKISMSCQNHPVFQSPAYLFLFFEKVKDFGFS